MAELPIRLTGDALLAVSSLLRCVHAHADDLAELEAMKPEADGSILAEGRVATAVARLYESIVHAHASRLCVAYTDWRDRWHVRRLAEQNAPAPKRARKAARRG